MTTEAPCVAIVDAYSSGNLLAPEFISRGFRCVHIQAAADVPPPAKSSFHEDDFRANIVHRGSVEKTVEDCKRFPLKCLIAGSETGVELADDLSQRLGLKSNGTTLSASRRDKFAMVAQIRRNNLPTIPSIKTKSYEEGLRWIEETTGWPVVIKPLRSAGTDSVAVCNSAEQFHTLFNSTLGKCDQFGSPINELLIQRKMFGDEYIVDTVSRCGKHHVTNVWLIVKGSHNSGDFVCEYNQLLNYDEANVKELIEYALGIVDALGIKNGPAHTELLLTTEGPVLIETAARLHGAGFPIYSRECVGYSQVDLTVDAYVDTKSFESKSSAPYRLRKNLVIVEMISAVDGKIKALRLDDIKALPSYHSMKIELEPGDHIDKTIDVFSSPGHVVLIHPDLETIWRDYDYIRRLESQGLLYQV